MANVQLATATSILAGNAGWNLPSTLDTTLLTVDADKIVKINTIIATSVHGVDPGKVTLYIDGMGSGATGVTLNSPNSSVYLLSALLVPAGSTLVVLDAPIYLMEGDILKGGCNEVDLVDLLISYEVLDDA